jgi:phosphohistidine phosphatase
MAKRLILIRHGKANDALAGYSDFTRTLRESGVADSYTMAERLSSRAMVPEIVISSPAVRALNTALRFSEVWGISAADIRTELDIYEAQPMTLLKIANSVDNAFGSAAIFGHNPGITEFANYLIGEDGVPNMPTSGVVVIDFPFDDWKYLTYQTGSVLLFDYPKSTRDGL